MTTLPFMCFWGAEWVEYHAPEYEAICCNYTDISFAAAGNNVVWL